MQEEKEIGLSDEVTTLEHETALYTSLIVSAFGSFFIGLALFRLLDIWFRVRQKKKALTKLPGYSITLTSVILWLIPLAFSVAGDAVLIVEASKEEELADKVQQAMVLKTVGAACNVALVIVYLALCGILASSIYISNSVEKASKQIDAAEKQVSPALNDLTRKPKRTFRKVVIMLMTLGTLVLIRFLYDLYIVLAVLLSGPIWDVYAYLILVVADGLIFLMTAYCSNLSGVKVPILVS